MGNPYRSAGRDGVTAADARTRFSYDEESGNLFWRISTGRNVKVGARAFTVSKGRKTVRIGGVRVPQSHVVFLHVRGRWPDGELDHRDRDSMNDRIGNLREATTAQNCMNQGPRKNSKTGVKGVHKHPQRPGYWAKISADGRRYDLGVYPTIEFAAGAYRIAAAAMHGQFSGV